MPLAFAVTTALAAEVGADEETAEFAALVCASDASAAHGPHRIVIAADVDDLTEKHGAAVGLSAAVGLADVVAIHLGLGGDEDLAWYATQEIGAVLDQLAQ